MSLIYCIGDIHGCLNELRFLVEACKNDAGDNRATFVFVGDYVDRGPDSAGVIDYLIEMNDIGDHDYIFLKGNHEDMMLEYILKTIWSDEYYVDPYDIWLINGGRETIKSYEDKGYRLDNHTDFLTDLRMYHRIGDCVFVHAGINPTLKLEEQSSNTMLWSRDYVGYKGDYIDNVKVFHGHTPTRSVFPMVTNNTINMDTACVFNGYLTAAKIECNEIKDFFVIGNGANEVRKNGK